MIRCFDCGKKLKLLPHAELPSDVEEHDCKKTDVEEHDCKNRVL